MLWFRAIWYITTQKNGTSALGLQRVLGVGSYKTAWAWPHKIRRAMARPGRDRLSGQVEVGETYIGAPETGGKRGRGAENKVLAAVAVEINDNAAGRIRIGIITDTTQESLNRFIQESVEAGVRWLQAAGAGMPGLKLSGIAMKPSKTMMGICCFPMRIP
jgi:hypothetical protein